MQEANAGRWRCPVRGGCSPSLLTQDTSSFAPDLDEVLVHHWCSTIATVPLLSPPAHVISHVEEFRGENYDVHCSLAHFGVHSARLRVQRDLHQPVIGVFTDFYIFRCLEQIDQVVERTPRPAAMSTIAGRA